MAPPGLLLGKHQPSAMSRRGGWYRAAHGTRIPNLGELGVSFKTREGHDCNLPFEIAEVERPLIAASHLAAAGNIVTFEEGKGTIQNTKNGKTIKPDRVGGVYLLTMRVESASSFPRPGP